MAIPLNLPLNSQAHGHYPPRLPHKPGHCPAPAQLENLQRAPRAAGPGWHQPRVPRALGRRPQAHERGQGRTPLHLPRRPLFRRMHAPGPVLDPLSLAGGPSAIPCPHERLCSPAFHHEFLALPASRPPGMVAVAGIGRPRLNRNWFLRHQDGQLQLSVEFLKEINERDPISGKRSDPCSRRRPRIAVRGMPGNGAHPEHMEYEGSLHREIPARATHGPGAFHNANTPAREIP